MLTDNMINRLERGEILNHVLGTEMVFIGHYPTVESGVMIQCRYQDGNGDFKIGEFYPQEFKIY